LARTRQTQNHDEIREWVERNGGRPAKVEGTGELLRIDFGEPDERLEPLDWDQFFEIFDRSGLGFLYDPQGRMNKFIQVGEDVSGIGKTQPRARAEAAPRRKGAGRKKASRKTGARKTARGKTAARKKTGGPKKSAGRKKRSTRKSATRKGGRKYSRRSGEKVRESMDEMKRGQLRAGRSGKKVRSRKQAIAIGLSEARREGARVPARPRRVRRSSGSRKKR
jgi:hypothetical protein